MLIREEEIEWDGRRWHTKPKCSTTCTSRYYSKVRTFHYINTRKLLGLFSAISNYLRRVFHVSFILRYTSLSRWITRRKHRIFPLLFVEIRYINHSLVPASSVMSATCAISSTLVAPTHVGNNKGVSHQDQGQQNCHNDTTYTSDHLRGILGSPGSSSPACAPRMRFGAAHNPGENTLARQPGTFRNGNRQLDGGTAPWTTLSGGTYLSFRGCSCSVASLSSDVAQVASVKIPRAPTTSADDFHGVVLARKLALQAWFHQARNLFHCFFFLRRRERALSATCLSAMA